MIANLRNTFTNPADAAKFWKGKGKDPILKRTAGRTPHSRSAPGFLTQTLCTGIESPARRS
jgi:hypothetical protein